MRKQRETHLHLREFSKQEKQVAITEVEPKDEVKESFSQAALIFLNNRKPFPSFKQLKDSLGREPSLLEANHCSG